MSTKIQTPGAYVGIVAESGISLSTNGFPQWVARLVPQQKYVESKEEIAHFQKQQLLLDGNPNWVDWSAFDEEIFAYMVLYGKDDKATKNAEQLNKATGWVAPDFESLDKEPVKGATIFFRVENNSYTNAAGQTKEGLEVKWIDHKDASSERQLKTLDQTGIQALMAKYGGKPAAKPAAPAAPQAPKPFSPSAPAPAAALSAATPPKPTAPPVSAPSAPAAPAAPKTRQRKAPAVTPPALPAATPSTATPSAPALPAETTMEGAWEYVILNKGQKHDQEVENAWREVALAISAGGDPNNLTPAQWAQVRDQVMSKLAA